MSQTYSVNNIKLSKYQINYATASISGTYTQSLDYQQYIYNLTSNVTSFRYTNPNISTYNFLINAGTYSFTLGTGSYFKTVGATALGFTGSFVMSGNYDGSIMWISTIKNYSNV